MAGVGSASATPLTAVSSSSQGCSELNSAWPLARHSSSLLWSCIACSISTAIWSRHGSSMLSKSPVTRILLSRARSNTFSTMSVKATMSFNPNKPAEPLMVCAARNISLIVSGSVSPSSRRSNAASMELSKSSASAKKVCKAASRFITTPLRTQGKNGMWDRAWLIPHRPFHCSLR